MKVIEFIVFSIGMVLAFIWDATLSTVGQDKVSKIRDIIGGCRKTSQGSRDNTQ